MRTDELLKAFCQEDPHQAALTLQEALAQTLAHLDTEVRREILLGLTGEAGYDKVSSLVHL